MTPFIRSLFFILAAIVLTTSGCSKEAKKARLIERADRNFKAEQFEKAEIDYLSAVSLASDPTAIRQLGFIYHTEGRLREAYMFLKKASELEPENSDVQLKLGLVYLAVGKPDEARGLAGKVLAKRPGDEAALLLLAETATIPKKIQEVRQQIEQLRGRDRERPAYHIALGTLFSREQKLGDAEREFNSALKLDTASSGAQLALGNVYWNQNQLDKAEEFFQKAVRAEPLRSARRLRYVDFQIRTGKITDARKNLEEITSKAPDYAPAWSYLIRVLFAEKKFDDCAALITKVLNRDSANYEALIYSAYLKLIKGEAASAIVQLEKINTLYGQSPDVHFQLGRAYLMSGDATKAVRSLERASALDPESVEPRLLLAEIKIQQGNAAAVVSPLTQLIKNKPQIVQAHLLLATAYHAQQKTDDAAAVYTKMGTLFPKDPLPFTLLGATLLQQNKRSQARKAFEQSLQIAPDYSPAIEALVDFDISEKKYEEALAQVQKQMAANPEAVGSWLLLTKVQLAQKKFTEAEVSLKKCISLNPEHRVAYLILSQLYLNSDRDQEALKNLGMLVQKTNDVTALMQIGMIHNDLKNFPAARDAYQKILKVSPKFTPALNNLAYLYSEHLDDLEKAQELAQKSRQLLPSDPFTADTLGWIYFKRGDYPRALSLLQEGATKLPGLGEIQFHLGMTYYMMGLEAPARRAFQNAVQFDKEFPGKETARQRLVVLNIEIKTAEPEMLAWLEKKLKADPNDPVVSMRLATLQERNGAFEQAIKTYENALAQNPKNAFMTFQLAKLYMDRVKDPEKALAFATKARALAPEDPEIAYALGRIAFQSKDHPRALSLLQECAEKLSEQPDFLYDLALANYSMGRLAEAEEALQTAVGTTATFSNFDAAQRFLIFLKLSHSSANAQSAEAQVQETLKAEPNYVPALAVAGMLQEQQGNVASARLIYEKILGIYPSFSPAIKQLAILYSINPADDKKAYDLTVKARTLYPQDPDVAKALGMIAFRRNEFARAVPLLKESSQKRVADAELFFHLGVAYNRLKQKGLSKEALTKALALGETAPFAIEAKKILTELK